MKRFAAHAVAVLLAFSVTAPLAAQPSPTAVIMTVNEEPVFFWEVSMVLRQVQMEMISQGVKPENDTVIKAAIKRVVDARLLAQEARRKGMQADAGRVGSTLADIEQRAGGRDQLEATLEQMGITYDQLRSNVAEADLVQVYITTEIDPKVMVTASEIESFYNANPQMFERPDMVRARHILIRISRQTDQAEKDAARARAVAAHTRVAGGEDFAKVAAEVSEEPNAARGGDLGFFAADTMVPVLSDAAFALDIGEISGVIESQFGFHILKLEERRPASTMSFAEAKEPVERMLHENKAGELVSQRLADLSASAKMVEISPPEGGAPGESGGR